MDDNSSTVQSTAPVTAPAATFTQDDVDRIVRGRVNEVNAKVNDLTQQLITANAKISDMAASLVKYQQSAFLTSLGVPTELQDFVAFEANKQVSGDVTFEQAAQNFVKDKGSLYGIGVSSNGNGQGQNATSEQGTESTNPATSGQQNTENKNNSASSGQQNTEDKNNSASSDKSGTENKSSNKPDSKNNAQGNKVSTATNASGEGNTDTSTDLDAAVQAYLKQHHLG